MNFPQKIRSTSTTRTSFLRGNGSGTKNAELKNVMVCIGRHE